MTINEAYDILNLRHNASANDLVVAYRRLVKVYHPDYNSSQEAWSTEKMTRLNIAYETARAFMESEGRFIKGRGNFSGHGSKGPAENGGSSHSGSRSRYRGSGFTSAGGRADPARDTGSSTGTGYAHRSGEASRAADYTGHTPRTGSHPETSPHTGRNFEPAMSPHFAARFEGPWAEVLESLYIFYQYGLENVHLRREGVRRFRYRQAVRGLKSGLSRLQPLSGETVTEFDVTRLKAAREFSQAFLQNMLIEKYYIPTHLRSEVKAYNHYNNGSQYLDVAIKNRFCSDLTEPRDKRAAAGTLQIVQHELITVIAKYTESTWVPESMIKMHLLDRFNKVVQVELTA